MTKPIDAPVRAADAAPRTKPSNYPEPFFSRMLGRSKRPLGDLFGLDQFGVNFTELAPGGESSLFHQHTQQQEFIYVIEGPITLVLADAEHEMEAGMCFGFTPEQGGHHLVNRSDKTVAYLEIGTRMAGDEGVYPRDDLKAVQNADMSWSFRHKDDTPYD